MAAALALADQVHDLLLDRAARLADTIGGPDLRAMLEQHVEANRHAIVSRLVSGEDREVADMVADLWVLAHGDSEPAPEWWQTPLGSVTARSIEVDDSAAVTPRVAARMLGVAEPTVYRLRDRGVIERHPLGGITRASVLAQIASNG